MCELSINKDIYTNTCDHLYLLKYNDEIEYDKQILYKNIHKLILKNELTIINLFDITNDNNAILTFLSKINLRYFTNLYTNLENRLDLIGVIINFQNYTLQFSVAKYLCWNEQFYLNSSHRIDLIEKYATYIIYWMLKILITKLN